MTACTLSLSTFVQLELLFHITNFTYQRTDKFDSYLTLQVDIGGPQLLNSTVKTTITVCILLYHSTFLEDIAYDRVMVPSFASQNVVIGVRQCLYFCNLFGFFLHLLNLFSKIQMHSSSVGTTGNPPMLARVALAISATPMASPL